LQRWHLCLTPMGLERLSLAVRGWYRDLHRSGLLRRELRFQLVPLPCWSQVERAGHRQGRVAARLLNWDART
jgi:hypothetical protein